ncbi:oxidoreductase [Bacillus sp. 2205SS5-2]|uniref:oxidoreductase n=1 Tax=Bacillus sp. 2205SS5-2 TaxID=3109031 RepID=UPI0030058BF6
MDIVNVGIVGYGYSGKTIHGKLLAASRGFNVKAIVTSKHEKVNEDFPEAKALSSIEELIMLDEIDLVVITTPNHLHYDQTKQALEAGKHVLVEKPFVVQSEQGKELILLAKERELVLSVFHNRRWDSDFLTVKKLLQDDTLGQISTYKAQYDRYRPHSRDRWKENAVPGAGVLYDLGAHLLDGALQLFGVPDWIWADAFAQRGGNKAEDYFHLVLSYGEKRVILHCGSIVPKSGPRFEVHGTKGSFVKLGMDCQEEQLNSFIHPTDAMWGVEPSTMYGELTLQKQDKFETTVFPSEKGNYLLFYEKLHQAITEQAQVPVTSEEANQVIIMIEAALLSVREKRVISLKDKSAG